MKKYTRVLLASLFLFCLGLSSASALGLESFGLLSGYMSADLKNKDDMEVIPLFASFGFDLKPFAEKLGIETEGVLQFQVEPFVGCIYDPVTNAEMGVAGMFKYAFPLSERFMPYFKIGTGLYYYTLHTREQGTQFNFASSAAAGFSWYFREDASLDCEYRYRHVSNAGMSDSNGGIDTEAILAGITFYFD